MSHPSENRDDVIYVRFVVNGQTKTAKGRAAWALSQLVQAGAKGCTPIDNAAPRWSHYVFLLRRMGVPVRTITESHAGAFSGHHARYRLDCSVQILETRTAESRAA